MATTNKTRNPADQATALYKSLFEYTIDANRAIVAGIERSWQEQIETFEGAVDSIKPLADAKQPADFMSAQFALATDLNQKAVAATTNLLKIQRDTGEELREIANESVKAFSTVLPRAA